MTYRELSGVPLRQEASKTRMRYRRSAAAFSFLVDRVFLNMADQSIKPKVSVRRASRTKLTCVSLAVGA